MDNWDEVRTAFQVAQRGTVSGAAEALGVHHATVIRHIDAIEGRLGVKLFQRHARGYTPTEAGEDLMRVAQTTDDQFSQLVGRIKGRGSDVSGELLVTSLSSMAPQIVPSLVAFQEAHPEVSVRFLTGDRLFRLEYGEAHVAIRAGKVPPDQADNVVQHLTELRVGAYASAAEVAAHGAPQTPEEYSKHRFIGHNDPDNRAPFSQWLNENVPPEAITFRASDMVAMDCALRSGAGIGPMLEQGALGDPELVEIHAPRAEWSVSLWLVTHVDLHRTSKVQALAQFIKAQAKANLI